MAGRRDGPLMRNNAQSFCKSKITGAIAIGVFFGCVFALFFPNGFFVSSSAPVLSHHLAKSITQVRLSFFLMFLALSNYSLFDM